MTDMAQGTSQGQNIPASPAEHASSAPVHTHAISPAASAPASVEEKTFRQSEVNDIVGRAKAEAVDRFRRQEPYQQPSISSEEVRKLAGEEAQRLRNEWIQDAQRNAQQQYASQIATEFNTKMNAGKSKYEDFDSKVAPIKWDKYTNSVQLLNAMENAGDIAYEFGNNPLKLHQIEQLAERDPDLAFLEMRRLSDSIKANGEAAKVKLPNEPLSQMRPSNTGTGNGAMTVGDYRKKYRG